MINRTCSAGVDVSCRMRCVDGQVAYWIARAVLRGCHGETRAAAAAVASAAAAAADVVTEYLPRNHDDSQTVR